jgi:hypothetical protein
MAANGDLDMDILETVRARLIASEAASARQDEPRLTPFQERVNEINDWMNARMDDAFESSVSVEEVAVYSTRDWPEADVRHGPRFLFEKLQTGADIEGLKQAFAGEVNDRWPYDIWLDRAAEKGLTVITVKREGDARPAGFVALTTGFDLDVDDEDWDTAVSLDELRPPIDLRVNISSVYVAPSQRQRGFASALCWAVDASAYTALAGIGESFAADAPLNYTPDLNVWLHGEAHSWEGARFCQSVSERLTATVEILGHETVAFATHQVDDHIDYDDWLDSAAPAYAAALPPFMAPAP